jgi:hypothetical protein
LAVPTALKKLSRTEEKEFAWAKTMLANDGLTVIKAFNLRQMLIRFKRLTDAATFATTATLVAPWMTPITGEQKKGEMDEMLTDASMLSTAARKIWLTMGSDFTRPPADPKREEDAGSLKQTEIKR